MASSPTDSVAATLATATVRFLTLYLPFQHMEAEALQFLAANLDLGYYPQGTVILAPSQAEPRVLHIIQRGTVQVVPFNATLSGNNQPVSLGVGECFSVSALLEQRAVVAPYTATADTFCYELPAEKFPELLELSPVFREYATRYLTSMLKESRRLIKLNFTSTTGEQQTMNRTLRSLVTRAPVTCQPHTPVVEVLRIMRDSNVGSVLITSDDGCPQGIFTRHDVLDRVALVQNSLERPIRDVMTPDPLALSAEDSAYDAALLIADRGIRHIPVCDGKRLIGVVTERDLFALQRISLRGINRTISDAQTIDDLRAAASDIHRLAHTLLGQGVAAEQLTLIISTLNDALTRQVIDIERRRFGLDDLRWCWLAFGSEGRYEQTISTDQDNGIIFEISNESPDISRERLLPFAQAVNRALDTCGFPLCTGNIMAGNSQWCLSLAEWQATFDSWVTNTDPQALLNAVIFFDFRVVHGESGLARTLQTHLVNLTQGNRQFQRQLAQFAVETRPPLGLISDFVTERAGEYRGTIDLKKSGARLFTDAARVLSLAAGVTHTGTAQRLRQTGPMLNMPATEITSLTDAFFFLQTLRLRSQIAENVTVQGANRIDPGQLNEVDRRILKESLRQAGKLQSRLALDYQL